MFVIMPFAFLVTLKYGSVVTYLRKSYRKFELSALKVVVATRELEVVAYARF